MPKIGPPPSAISGPLLTYLNDVQRVINGLPQVSFFSGTNPNSVLTGRCGDLGINLGSASTSSRVWLNAADPSSAATTQGWVVLRILQ